MSETPMIQRIFLGFGTGILRDAANLIRLMIKNNISVEEFLEYADKTFTEQNILIYEANKQAELRKRKYVANARRCVCGAHMRLSPVNDKPGNQVGGNFKSMWWCTDIMGCGESVFSENDVLTEARKHGLEEFYRPRTQRANPLAPPTRKRNASQRRPCNRATRR